MNLLLVKDSHFDGLRDSKSKDGDKDKLNGRDRMKLFSRGPLYDGQPSRTISSREHDDSDGFGLFGKKLTNSSNRDQQPKFEEPSLIPPIKTEDLRQDADDQKCKYTHPYISHLLFSFFTNQISLLHQFIIDHKPREILRNRSNVANLLMSIPFECSMPCLVLFFNFFVKAI